MSKVTIVVEQNQDDLTNYQDIIISKLKSRWKNQEDMESRISVYCIEIAAELGAKFSRKGDDLLFDCRNAVIEGEGGNA